MIKSYLETASMEAKSRLNAGLLYLLPDCLLRIVYLAPLLLLWRALMARGVQAGMNLSQMLSYTLMSAVLGDLLVVKSPLTDWIMDGPLISLYQRPLSVYGHVVAQTLGSAVPGLLVFSVPMLALAPLLGISVMPASLWFLPSLLLCVSLGFALEFLFACLLVRMVNASWLTISIRNAVYALFSGSLLPFAVLPFDLGAVLRYLPLGSLAGAPLAVYVGSARPLETLLVQVFWNLVLWPAAIAAFRKSQEKLTSHGG